MYESFIAHSTATPEAPAFNIQKYESRTWRSVFIHYAVDWDEIIQILLGNTLLMVQDQQQMRLMCL